MPFNPLPKKEFKEFKRIEFVDLVPGKHLVRLLTDTPLTMYVHSVQQKYLRCLGDDCPICQNNKEIIYRSPDSFRSVPEYSGKTLRALVNLLDLTPVKVCPNEECKHPNKKAGRAFPDVCGKCGRPLTKITATPLNKVRVMNMGSRLYDQLVDIENAVRDESGDALGLTHFDLELTVVGTMTDRVITAEETDPLNAEVREVNPDDLFDLERAVITLPADKMLDFKAGARLKDIFASINSKKNSQLEKEVEKEASDINDELEEMFKPPEL